jgi:hypothetical protein
MIWRQSLNFIHKVVFGALATVALQQPVAHAGCSEVAVHARAVREGLTFGQRGAGVVFARQPGDSSRFLLLPNHVVSVADTLFVRCGRTEAKVIIMGKSVTGDLAVAEIPKKLSKDFTPAFFANGENVHEGGRVLQPGRIAGKVEILVPALDSKSSPALIEVERAISYLGKIQNPVAGDDGSILTTSGVRPGMSGSTLLVNGKFAGIVVKTLLADSISAVVPASDIIRSIPELMKGLDPYGERSANKSYLSESVVFNQSKRALQRFHSLWLRNVSAPSAGGVELKDVCHAGRFTETSRWEPEAGGGWGEGGDGVSVGGDKSQSGLIVGIDMPTESELREGRQPRPVSLYLPGRSDCSEDGVVLPSGRRLVGIRNLVSGGADQTLVIHSVDDLASMARVLGMQLLPLIEKLGVFSDEPISSICQTQPFQYSDRFEVAERERLRVVSSSAGKQTTSFFVLERLKPESEFTSADPGADGLNRGPKDGLLCKQDSHVLHLRSDQHGSWIGVDLKINNEYLDGTIRLGKCTITLERYRKDFWHAEIDSDGIQVGLEIGISIKRHGYIRFIPRNVPNRCWQDMGLDLETDRMGAVQWQVD